MAEFTIHYYHEGQYQTSVFDYEGWAHPRDPYWSKEKIEVPSLNEARDHAKKKGANRDSYITDKAGTKYTLGK
jgi:hypothetical protein